MLYHQTKDLEFVKRQLGHVNVHNTEFYIQISDALFSESDDGFV